MEAEVQKIYGNRVRVRSCGILVCDDKMLLIRHESLAGADFWSPPGGGIEFGETARDCLKREFLEETGLEIEVSDFLFTCEFIASPLHAVELFFKVVLKGGTLKTGFDPEMKSGVQLIRETKFLSWRELKSMSPDSLHGVFRLLNEPSLILQLNGYLTI